MFSTPLFAPYSDAGPNPNGNPANYAGVDNFTVDGSSYDPYWKGVGVDNQWTSEGVNDQIDGKLITVPPRYSKNWQVEYPIGALLFGSPAAFDDLASRATRVGRRPIFRNIDRMELLTPEQMNYHLAHKWLNDANTRKMSLLEMFNAWRLIGVNISPNNKINNGLPNGDDLKYLGEERVIDYRPFADEKVVNYWGSGPAGNDHPYLFLVLKMVRPEGHSWTFKLNQTGDDVRTEKFDSIITKYAPQWVAVASEYARSPAEKDLEYEYLDENGAKRMGRGLFVRVGRLIQNPEHQPGVNISVGNCTDIRDMQSSASRRRLDVMVDVREVL